MWLSSASSFLAATASRIYYRYRDGGSELPRRGPLLLLANHPNALLDPALVATAAGRPVRFLAKATLVEDRFVGWLVRATGAIPVYRRQDDPRLMARNVEMFEAVIAALGRGAAVGVFPEGLSHDEPSLAPLKTGTARIALGFVARHGRVFPIVPVGLVFRDKGRFRSIAYALRGTPVVWDDLADRTDSDSAAVAELTSRIDAALRHVTINLENHEDARLVETVEQVWAAEIGAGAEPSARVARIERTTRVLARVRREADPRGAELAGRVLAHRRRLDWLGVTPEDVSAPDRLVRRLRRRALVLLPWLPLAATIGAAGWLLFWPPYRLTGLAADAARPERVMRSTYQLLFGIGIYGAWIAGLVFASAIGFGALAALVALAVIPALGLAGLRLREAWRGVRRDFARLAVLRSRGRLVELLRGQQRELAGALRELDRVEQSDGS